MTTVASPAPNTAGGYVDPDSQWDNGASWVAARVLGRIDLKEMPDWEAELLGLGSTSDGES
ncbi:hypothetical protein [Actinomyces gaoshouyii]|uniref:hypothetical protein n=1 Tax=Actinomyces gaoshouyii TaxID=1960083 RepID=UPI0009BEFE5E|nr:hypothetical protein [Actinomyces gaoshouyii]ARD42517.1 hypothetical protein B6G06_09320 [Actinomyces gaoshouyii]